MVAAWGKGSHVILGKNKLSKLASSEWDGYPEPLGVHAELDLYLKMGRKMKGGTIYIAGNKRPSRKPLPNTAPCIYCMELIMTTQTKWIVYFKEGIPTKSHISDLH